MKETEIIQGCIKQDRRCQNALYKLYFPLMSSIALRYSNNESEAVQHINYGFLKVLQNLHTYDKGFALATFIRNILINHIIDEFRKSKKYINNIHVTDITEFEVEADFNSGEQKLHADDLLNLIKKLPDVSGKVFCLYAIDGFKHKEIGELLGITEGTSKWHVNQARKKLMELIHQEKQFKSQESESKKLSL